MPTLVEDVGIVMDIVMDIVMFQHLSYESQWLKRARFAAKNRIRAWILRLLTKLYLHASMLETKAAVILQWGPFYYTIYIGVMGINIGENV